MIYNISYVYHLNSNVGADIFIVLSTGPEEDQLCQLKYWPINFALLPQYHALQSIWFYIRLWQLHQERMKETKFICDFSLKSEEMCHFFDKRGYPASVVQAGHHRAQQIDRQSALQTSQKEHNNRSPFTLTFHPHNLAVKSIILKNFKLYFKVIPILVKSFRNLH